MQLKQINLCNFRKFDELVVNFQDGINEIKAPNKYGKSTIADAVFFTLFGKLYDGRSDFTSLKPDHNPRAIVSSELVFQLSSGRTASLRKDYFEEWGTERGNDVPTFKGHVTRLFADGVQVKTASEYNQKVIALFNATDFIKSISDLMLIVSPYHFAKNMTPSDRLNFITSLIGEVRNEDVFRSNEMLRKVEADLITKYSNETAVADYYRQSIKDATKTVADLESQVKALTPSEPITETERQTAEINRTNLQKALLNLEAMKNGEGDPELKRLKESLNALNQDLNASLKSDRENVETANAEIRAKVRELEGKRADIQNRISQATVAKMSAERNAQMRDNDSIRHKGEANGIKANYDKEKARVYEAIESKCPCCGHVSIVSEEDWNDAKARNLKALADDFKNKKAQYDLAVTEGNQERFKAQDLEQGIIKLRNDIAPIESEISALNLRMGKVVDSQATISIQQSITETNNKIATIKAQLTASTNYATEKQRLESELAKASAIIDKANADTQNRQRMANLDKQLAEAKATKAKWESKQMLFAEYRKAKLAILEKKASDVFPGITFQFLKKNIADDGVNEVCNILVQTPTGLVEFPNANTQEQIRIGVKLCGQIAKAIGAEQPFILIDNAEAVTQSNRKFECGQAILLIAHEDEPKTEDKPKIDTHEINVMHGEEQISLFDIGGDK
jgi:hypothetical protein